MTVPEQGHSVASASSCPSQLRPLVLLSVWENKVITGGSGRQTAQSELCRAWFSKMPPLEASESSLLRRALPGDTDGDKGRVSWKGACGPSFPSRRRAHHLSFGHQAPALAGPPQGLLSSTYPGSSGSTCRPPAGHALSVQGGPSEAT